MNVLSIAHFILNKRGDMSAMKLQKLVYYSQAWSLVWDEQPLFDSEIQAWANGPVCPDLYNEHRGRFLISSDKFSQHTDTLTKDQVETIDAVLDYYGDKSANWLSELTHKERPWLEARGDTPVEDRCTNIISHDSMAEYYGSLRNG